MDEVVLRLWREAFGNFLRGSGSGYEDVSEDDVNGAWERFGPQRQRILAAHPLDFELPGDETLRDWLRQVLDETWKWILTEVMEEALSEPGSGWRSSVKVGADGKPKVDFFQEPPAKGS
jgi:hypothetical protein